MPGRAESYTLCFEQSNYSMYDVGCISGLKEAQMKNQETVRVHMSAMA